MEDLRNKAKFFRPGFKDLSTKDSHKKAQNEALLNVAKKNPHWKPVNHRGTQVNLSQVEAAVTGNKNGKKGMKGVDAEMEKYRSAKLPWIAREVQRLCELGLAYDHTRRIVHDPAIARRADEYVGNIYQISDEYGRERFVYDENTCVALRSGCFLVNGEIVFMHTDGSICRPGVLKKTDAICGCGYVHEM